MATALAKGLVGNQVVASESVSVFDPSAAALQRFQKAIPACHVVSNAGDLAKGSDVVVVAVKPQVIDTALAQIKGKLSDCAIVVSVVTGASIECIRSGLGSDRIVRVMPNTPCLVGQGASGYAVSPALTEHEVAQIQSMLESVGLAFRLSETLLDAVTGLSGSGPAYVYTMIEALSDGGVNMGLPRDVASSLAAQTVLGAASMVVETGQHPAVLREQVTSPGGTTIAAIQSLEDHGFRSAVLAAVETATQRARELGKS